MCIRDSTTRLQFSAAVHAVLTLGRRQLTARIAGDVGVKLEDSLLLDHHPSDPGIGHGQQHEQANNGTGAKGEELNT